MKNSIAIKIPNDEKYVVLVTSLIKKLAQEMFNKKEIKSINRAIKELINNAIEHAYKDLEGEIEIEAHIFAQGIRVDIKDFGLPMSSQKHLSVPIDLKDSSGFNKIYKLVDNFEYKNLGKDGKVFSITKYYSKILNFENIESDIKVEDDKKVDIKNLKVRYFKKGDEEAVSHLIYHNYGHSYYKDLFYYPQKILEYENEKIYSVIAEIDGEIIGHFALARLDETNIAEVGVAVVHPKYKGLGIMNQMFDKLLFKAKELELSAIFGEAIMYHPFSQKSNLRHGFEETCLEIGKVPESIKLQNNELTKKEERGSVLIAYKVLFPTKKSLYLPTIYEKEIKSIYDNTKEIEYRVLPQRVDFITHSKLSYKFDPLCNVGTIIIDNYGDDFTFKFKKIMNYLLLKHCDMIYADVNLETIGNIDEVVEILNKGGFFYSGVLFFKHQIYDYLHLQYRHSNIVGKDNLVCYSDFAKDMYNFMLFDEKRVKRM